MKQIKDYLDRCFSEYEMTQELAELKDELLGNAAARYADLTAEGKSEAEASEEAILAMGDLDALITDIGASKKAVDLVGMYKDRLADNLLREVSIQLTSSDLYLEQDLVDEPLVSIDGNESSLQISMENGVFSIRTVSWIAPDSVKVIIPDDLEKLSVRSASGDISMEDLQVGILSVQTMSGDIEADELSCQEIEMRATAGDIEADTLNGEERVELISEAGDINLDSVSSPVIHVRATAGDIEMTVTGPADELKVDSAAGDIDLTVEEDAGHILCSSRSGDIDAQLEGMFDHAEITSVSGDIDVELGQKGNLSITARSTIGDVHQRVFSAGGTRVLQAKTTTGDISIR